MRSAIAAVAMILGAAAFGQEPAVERSTIWMDAVKRLGTLTGNMTAELKIPESHIKQVTVGQTVLVDMRPGVVSGKVVRIDSAVQAGTGWATRGAGEDPVWGEFRPSHRGAQRTPAWGPRDSLGYV